MTCYEFERLIDENRKKEYGIFNIGTGKPLSVLELITAFQEATGVKLNYKLGQMQNPVLKNECDHLGTSGSPSGIRRRLPEA